MGRRRPATAGVKVASTYGVYGIITVADFTEAVYERKRCDYLKANGRRRMPTAWNDKRLSSNGREALIKWHDRETDTDDPDITLKYGPFTRTEALSHTASHHTLWTMTTTVP